MRRAIQFAAVVIATLAISNSAFAQGCSQCLTYASAAGRKAQASLDLGIGVLLIPTLFLFAGILLLFVWRARAASVDMRAADDCAAERVPGDFSGVGACLPVRQASAPTEGIPA